MPGGQIANFSLAMSDRRLGRGALLGGSRSRVVAATASRSAVGGRARERLGRLTSVWFGRVYWNETLAGVALLLGAVPIGLAFWLASATEPWSPLGVLGRALMVGLAGYVVLQAASGAYLGRNRIYGLWRGRRLRSVSRADVTGVEVAQRMLTNAKVAQSRGYSGPYLGVCWVPHLQRVGQPPEPLWALAQGRKELTELPVARLEQWAKRP